MKERLLPCGVGPFHLAPDHCEYKVPDSEGPHQVHSLLCLLCKKCDFSSTLQVHEQQLTTEEERLCARYLTEINSKIASSIARQRDYLESKNRLPLVILVSSTLCDTMFQYINKEGSQDITHYYLVRQSPLCSIMGCPVYLSPKLTKTNILVVGEVSWK